MPPDDDAVYWFSASDVRKWLLPEVAHSEPSKTASKPAPSPAKRKAEDTVVTSPAKKGKRPPAQGALKRGSKGLQRLNLYLF